MHPCTRAQLSDTFSRLGGQGVGSTDQRPGTNPATLTTAQQGGQEHEAPGANPAPGNQTLTTPHDYNPGGHTSNPGTYQAPACQYLPIGRLRSGWVGNAKID